MGKRAREERRTAERLRRREEAQRLRVAVLVAPGGDATLRNELALLRPALLYGDHVMLHSITASYLASIAALAHTEGHPLIDVLLGLDETTLTQLGADPAAVGQIREACAATPYGRDLVNLVGDAMLADAERQFAEVVEVMLSDAGASEIVAGLEDGRFEIANQVAENGEMDETLEEWVRTIERVLHDPFRLPLLDDDTVQLAEAAIREGRIRVPTRGPEVGRAAAGSGLLAMLPSFPYATIPEVIDIRAEAADPLRRYRTAVARLAREISARPWEASFVPEVEQLWATEVQPALDEISELFASAAFLKQLGSKWSDVGREIWKGTIAFCAGSLATRSAIVGASLGLGGTLVETVSKAATSSRELRSKAKSSSFYLLHYTESQLSSATARRRPLAS